MYASIETAGPSLQGGDGDDVLLASAAVDHMTGGQGADKFVFIAEQGADPLAIDKILDFQAGEDEIQLTAVTGQKIDTASLLFNENAQALTYRMEGDTVEYSISIQSHNGGLLIETDMKHSIFTL